MAARSGVCLCLLLRSSLVLHRITVGPVQSVCVGQALVLLQDYDNLAAEKAKLEEQARCAKPLRANPSRLALSGTGRYLFTKKRNAINERKRISQQKEEADE